MSKRVQSEASSTLAFLIGSINYGNISAHLADGTLQVGRTAEWGEDAFDRCRTKYPSGETIWGSIIGISAGVLGIVATYTDNYKFVRQLQIYATWCSLVLSSSSLLVTIFVWFSGVKCQLRFPWFRVAYYNGVWLSEFLFLCAIVFASAFTLCRIECCGDHMVVVETFDAMQKRRKRKNDQEQANVSEESPEFDNIVAQ